MDSLTELLLRGIFYGVLILEAWAVVDCAVRPTAAYVAAGKLTKPAWLAITALALVLTLSFGLFSSIFGLAAVIACIVYLVDVRPAVREVQGGGSRW